MTSPDSNRDMALGAQGPYMGKFVAEIPIPVGDLGIAALDTTEIGLEAGASWRHWLFSGALSTRHNTFITTKYSCKSRGMSKG